MWGNRRIALLQVILMDMGKIEHYKHPNKVATVCIFLGVYYIVCVIAHNGKCQLSLITAF